MILTIALGIVLAIIILNFLPEILALGAIIIGLILCVIVVLFVIRYFSVPMILGGIIIISLFILFQKYNEKSCVQTQDSNNLLNNKTKKTKNSWIITVAGGVFLLVIGLWYFKIQHSKDRNSSTPDKQEVLAPAVSADAPPIPSLPVVIPPPAAPAPEEPAAPTEPAAEESAAPTAPTAILNNQNGSENVDIIKNFIAAEDRRDIATINRYLSEHMNRYWDIQNPTQEQIYNRYQYVWGITTYSKNQILHIGKQNESTYVIFTRFEYEGNKRHKVNIRDNRVVFVFDNDKKITEIYGVD